MKKRIFSILLSIGMMLTLLPGTVLAADTSPGYRDTYVDYSEDTSVSKIIGNVRLTGTGGKQAGYNEGKTVYEEQISVTYSEPRTAAVEEKINAARTIVDNLAKDVKDRGKKGEYHHSVGTSTSAYWDNRTYTLSSCTVTAGPEGAISPGIAVEPVAGKEDTYADSSGKEYTPDKYQIRRTRIVSGNFGKETFYRVEANGYVEGYDITTAADPEDGGTATSDLTASLSGETVTFTATPAAGYEFRRWKVVDVSGTNLFWEPEISYTMPASDVTATAMFAPVQINLCTSRSDGGVLNLESTDGFNDDAWMTNMAVESGSQVTMVAEPDEGYKFAGYYEGIRQMDPDREGYGFVTGYDPEKLISNDKNYTFTVTEDTNVYALFEKQEAQPTLTVHWSSIDGVDLMDPIVIENIEKGTKVYEALGTIDLNMMSHPFEKDGYIASDYKVKKPITEYADRASMEADWVDGLAPIESNMDIYCIMMKEIDAAEITITPPVCGTEITTLDEEDPWSQTNPPGVSVPDGAGYKLYTKYEGASPAIWVNSVPDYEPFEGTIIGGEEHAAEIWLDTDFGYIFPNDVGITVNGGSLIEYQRTPGSLAIIASVTAEHDPAEAVEENRVEATCTEAGSYDEVVYCNGCHTELSRETKEIPAPGHTPGNPIKENEVSPTCTEAGSYDVVVYCTVCGEEISRNAVDIPALGHAWGEWIVDKEATEEEAGHRYHLCSRCGEEEEEVIPMIVASYGVVEGDGATWYTGSNDSLTFTFKRSVNDEKTFDLFQRIEIDGKEVAPANYEAKAGSVIITLKPEYIKTLAAGKHTLTAFFDNGKTADATFTIAEKKADVVPGGDSAKKETGVKTGDNANTGLFIGLGAAALLIIAAVLILMKRRSRNEK